jgi:signal transduction histidine kinase
VTVNDAFRAVLGDHEGTRDLASRFEIAAFGVGAHGPQDLPWERVLRQSFSEEEVWFDRTTSSRHRYHVHGRCGGAGGVLALADLAPHSLRLLRFGCAAARSALEPTLEDAGGRLAREVANVLDADAVVLFFAHGGSGELRALATSRADLEVGPIAAAIAAARTHSHREVAVIESPDVTDQATRALLAAGLRSLVAYPLTAGPDTVGAIVVAWRHEGAPSTVERHLLDAVSMACTPILMHASARAGGQSELTLLHKLRTAALAITELPSVHAMLVQLADQACDLLGARRGALGLSRPEGDDLAEVVVVDRVTHELASEATGQVHRLLDELAHDAFAATPSYIGAPLRVDGHSIGSVCLFEKEAGTPFTPEDEHVLELFVPQAALAIEHTLQLRRAQDISEPGLVGIEDELRAVIAHDMRTPISSILLQLDLLLERGDAGGDHVLVPTAALRRVRDAAGRISRMADDLFEASQIELSRIPLERRRLWLADAISDLVEQLAPTLGNREIRIHTSPEVPPVLADPVRLDEIVTNLVENAAKYSAPGAPIAIRIEPSEGGALVSVEDEGPGIGQADLPRVFERFYQCDATRRKRSGLGLGLYITKGLVEAHGGRIWVESKPGDGSKFHFWLPAVERTNDDLSADQNERDYLR